MSSPLLCGEHSENTGFKVCCRTLSPRSVTHVDETVRQCIETRTSALFDELRCGCAKCEKYSSVTPLTHTPLYITWFPHISQISKNREQGLASTSTLCSSSGSRAPCVGVTKSKRHFRGRELRPNSSHEDICARLGTKHPRYLITCRHK